MPLYFLLTAFLSGIAAISLASITTSWGRSRQFTPEVVDISCRLRKLLVGVLGITLLFTFWKVLVGLYAEPYREIYGDVIRGPLWQSEVILGLGFPLILAILAGYRRIRAVPAVLAASGLVLVGLFMGRLDMVLAGQALPLKALIAPELSSYIPSAAEIMVVVGALSLCVLLYAIGGTFLRLEAVPLAHSSSTKDT